MKKLLAILLSAMLVFSMVACSNDTPSPQAPVETPTELDKVNDKLDSASSAFESVEAEDDGQGNLVQTVKNIEMDGYTIKEGTKTVASDGTETTALTIEYEENGQKVQIQDTQSEKVSVSAVNAEGEEVVLDDEVAKETTETALTTAKAIPASQFVRTGENEYTYTPASTMARLARTGESVSKVVISFTYEDSKAVYTYEVTYITAGNTLTVTQEVSKETKKLIEDKDGNYVESNDEIKDNLMNDFSLGNLQPGGNSFYREEALDAAYILRDGGIDVPSYDGFTPTDYTVTDSNNDTITIENGAGKKIAFRLVGISSEHIMDSSTSESTVSQTVSVVSFDIDIPFISEYVKAGDEITLDYDDKYVNDGSSSSVTITVKDISTDGATPKLVLDLKESSTQNRSEPIYPTKDNPYEVNEHFTNTTVEFTLKDSLQNTVLASGSIKTEEKQTDKREVEFYGDGDSYRTTNSSWHIYDTKSTVTFETLTITELRDLFGVGEADTLVIETEQTSSHEENEFHEIINEKTETTITVNDEAFDYSTLIEKLLGNVEGLIDFVNSGLTLEYDGTTQPSKYNGGYYVYNPTTGYNNIEVDGITRIETTDFTLNIKKGAVDRLVELLEAMMGGNGSMPNVNPNDFGSGNMVFTRDYTFDSSFFGAKGVKFVENTPMSASMPTYRIEFKDGYMKGAYTFTEEELWNNNMYY